jgi:hypothetical protein
VAYLDLLNAVAQVVGGTKPSAAQVAVGSTVAVANQPYWYSGLDAQDSSGVAGLVGCFSLPTEAVPGGPFAMVIPDAWLPLEQFPTQGHERREDTVHVRVMAGHTDLQSAMAQLVNFADLVPTAFNTHMTLFGQANVFTAWCSQGAFLEVEWPVGTVYMAIQFTVQVQRSIPVTRS